MEDYIGTRLLFETSKGVVSGMLRIVDEDNGKLVIEDKGGSTDVFIEDIQRLEIVEETCHGNLSAGVKVQDECREGKKVSIGSVSSEGRDVAKKSILQLNLESHPGLKAGDGLAKDGESKASRMSMRRNSSNENDGNSRSSDKVEIDGKDARYAPEASEEDYYGMMDRAFNHFGPLEEEFCSIAARQAYRIFSTYFGTASARVEVFVMGDDAFSTTGFILGRLLLHSGKASSIVCRESSVRNARHRQSYLNSGGTITTTPGLEGSIHVYACNKCLIPELPTSNAKGFMYLDTPGSSFDGKETRIGLCFGSIPMHFRRFSGIMYFIDIEYPAALYKEFGLQRPVKSKIHKVK